MHISRVRSTSYCMYHSSSLILVLNYLLEKESPILYLGRFSYTRNYSPRLSLREMFIEILSILMHHLIITSLMYVPGLII